MGRCSVARVELLFQLHDASLLFHGQHLDLVIRKFQDLHDEFILGRIVAGDSRREPRGTGGSSAPRPASKPSATAAPSGVPWVTPGIAVPGVTTAHVSGVAAPTPGVSVAGVSAPLEPAALIWWPSPLIEGPTVVKWPAGRDNSINSIN